MTIATPSVVCFHVAPDAFVRGRFRLEGHVPAGIGAVVRFGEFEEKVRIRACLQAAEKLARRLAVKGRGLSRAVSACNHERL